MATTKTGGVLANAVTVTSTSTSPMYSYNAVTYLGSLITATVVQGTVLTTAATINVYTSPDNITNAVTFQGMTALSVGTYYFQWPIDQSAGYIGITAGGHVGASITFTAMHQDLATI